MIPKNNLLLLHELTDCRQTGHMLIWNPWHGCHKVSEGCLHCYMYFLDSKRDIDTSRVFRTENFDLPLQRRRDGSFRIRPGSTIQVSLSTDFFVEEADAWRGEAWEIIKQRPDVFFQLLTKRPQRFATCQPRDCGACEKPITKDA